MSLSDSIVHGRSVFMLALAGVALFGSFAMAAGEPAKSSADAVTKFNAHAQAALQAMQDKADSLKMQGAAVVIYLPGDKTTGWVSQMRVVQAFVKGKNNVLGVAYSKAAEMADTLADSGTTKDRTPLKGEYGYKGGAVRKVEGGYLLAAFSGGKAEDDYKVSQAGLDELGKNFEPAK